MAAVLEFMDSPLVTWIRTLIPGGTVDFQDLCDAVFLNDVLLTIDQRQTLSDLKRDAKDSNARIQNWLIFLRNLKAHYQDVLQQLIVMDLPNVLAIVHEPDKDSSVRELKKVLLLLLGCAVQCEDKESYINAITSLDIDTQAAIVGHIKEITDSADNVIPQHTNEEVDVKTLLTTVRKLTNYRDHAAEAQLKLSQERDYYRRELEGKRGPLTPPDHLGTVHLFNELNKYKVQVNHLLNELEDKGKQVADMKEELESNKTALNKLKFERIDLSKDAKSARAYRDELDMLREKAMKVDRLEKDVRKYKDKVNEIDFYKARVQELREDNNVLLDAKNKIEEQLTSANKRSENMVEDLVKAQLQLEEVSGEKESMQKKMEEIIEENAVLEFERTNMSEGYRGGLKRMLSTSSDLFSGSNLQLAEHPISEELNDSINCKVARLELDNEALQREVTEATQKLNDTQMELARLKAAAEREYKKKVSDLELQTVELRKRNSVELADSVHKKIQEVERQAHEMRKRMTTEFQHKVQKLEKVLLEKEKQLKIIQEDRSKEKHKVSILEKRNEEVSAEKEKYKSTIDHMQQSSQGRIRQLEQDVSSLHALNASLKRRLSELSQSDLNKENTYVALEAERTDNHRSSPSKHRHGKSLGRTQSLSQSFDASDYIRMRYSSGRSSRGSTSSIHSIHEMDPRYASSPKAHRSHRHSGSGHESDSERHRHKSSSSRSSVSGAQTHEVPRSSVQTQSSPFVRGSAVRSTAPARGVVAPQRRAPPPSPQPSASSPFMRHDKSRIAVAPSRSKSVDIEPFSRENKLRTTMPERKMVYVAPERRPPAERSESPDLGKLRYESPKRYSSTSSVDMYHTLPLADKHKMYASTTGVAMNSPTLEKSPSFHEKWKDYASDSGHATSPESPESSTNFENGFSEKEKEKRRRQTSLEISSSETIRTQFRSSTKNPQAVGEKWKYFVDKIVDLQDKNQKLFLENSDLKKVSNTQTFTSDLLRGLKERNLILEVENTKLKKIIEMLHGGGRNPNDPREYHFYTNV